MKSSQEVFNVFTHYIPQKLIKRDGQNRVFTLILKTVKLRLSENQNAKPCTNLRTIVSLNAEDPWMGTRTSPIIAKNLYRNIFLPSFLPLI